MPIPRIAIFRFLPGRQCKLSIPSTRYPNITVPVDPETVGHYWPILRGSRPSPSRENVTFLVELKNRRRRNAARSCRRDLSGTCIIRGNRTRVVQYPDVIIFVDGNAFDVSKDPVFWQFLRPGRIEFIARRILRSRHRNKNGKKPHQGEQTSSHFSNMHQKLPFAEWKLQFSVGSEQVNFDGIRSTNHV